MFVEIETNHTHTQSRTATNTYPAAIWIVLTNEPTYRAIHFTASLVTLKASEDRMMDSSAE